MKKVAIIGIQGVPAQYGGFETLADHLIGEYHSKDIEYTVFCSAKYYKKKIKHYKGASLKYIPLDANGMQSIFYDIVSMIKAIRGYDVVLILGVSGCTFLPIFRFLFRKTLIVNIDGLEHRREKWGNFTKWLLKKSESMALKYADIVIADNKGIFDYVKDTYQKEAKLIAYGGDHALRTLNESRENEILRKYSLVKNEYALSICRIEPENNCHLITSAYSDSTETLVFVGNWDKNEYGQTLKNECSKKSNIHTLSGIYDLDELYVIRKNCKLYLHGHSAGGTNPSLVEAMFFGKPILAFDVVYNRESTENKAIYFQNAIELDQHIHSLNSIDEVGERMKEIANRRYRWSTIVKEYENCY